MSPEDHANELPRYGDWRPSAHDCAGLGLPDRQDWRVLPVIRNRDSGVTDESNFEVAQGRFDDCELPEDVADPFEVHRFGHWANGWFEIILVNPECPDAMRVAGEITCALADYAILDEHDHSNREHEALWESWGQWGHSDLVDALCDQASLDSFSPVRDLLMDWGEEVLWDEHGQRTSGDQCTDEGASFDFDWANRISRDALAAIVLKCRKASHA